MKLREKYLENELKMLFQWEQENHVFVHYLVNILQSLNGNDGDTKLFYHLIQMAHQRETNR